MSNDLQTNLGYIIMIMIIMTVFRTAILQTLFLAIHALVKKLTVNTLGKYEILTPEKWA